MAFRGVMARRTLPFLLMVALVVLPPYRAAAQQTNEPPSSKDKTSDSFPDRFTTEDTRMTVGLDSASASSTASQFSYLIDFSLTAPLSHQVVTRKLKPRWGAWANVRLSGAPQQSVPSVKQFVGGFENSLVSGTVQDVVRSANVLGGVEYSLGRGFDFQDDYQFQPLLIAAAGFVTAPAPNGQPPVFEMTPEARQAFVPSDVDATNFKYIGFITPDRRNSFWQYYVGLRLKSHHFQRCEEDDVTCSIDRRVNFPGIIDLTFGQNASVNGGHLGDRRFGVFRFDAFYPLPTTNVTNAIYMFGGAYLQIDKARETPQIVLRAPSAAVTIPSPELYLHTLTEDERRRDLWSVGVGIDLVRLFRGAAKASDPATVGPEDGVIVAETARVRVLRLALKPNDFARLVPANDVLIPLGDATLQAEVGEEKNVEVWKSFQPVYSVGNKRTLRNTGTTAAEALIVKRKESPPFSGSPAKATSDSAGVQRVMIVDNSKLTVDRLICEKACTEKSVAYSGLAVIVPVSDKGQVTVEDEKAAQTWSKGSVIVLEQGGKHTFSGDAKTEAIVVRLK